MTEATLITHCLNCPDSELVRKDKRQRILQHGEWGTMGLGDCPVCKSTYVLGDFIADCQHEQVADGADCPACGGTVHHPTNRVGRPGRVMVVTTAHRDEYPREYPDWDALVNEAARRLAPLVLAALERRGITLAEVADYAADEHELSTE